MSDSGGDTTSGGSGGTGLQAGVHTLEENLAKLDDGKLIEPIDDITAHGEKKWSGSEPVYHDLNVVFYTKYDTSEWTGRAKKYKLELVQQGERVRRLEGEVKSLKSKLIEQNSAVEKAIRDVQDVYGQIEDTQHLLDQRVQDKQKLDSENIPLKRHLAQGKKAAERMKEQSGRFYQRMRSVEAEAEKSKAKYESCLGEKERLRLEREWFFRERILLEETTKAEEKDAIWTELKTRLAKLRHSMHRAWVDAKRDDVRGHLRSARWGPLREEWYIARRRMYEPTSIKSVSQNQRTSSQTSGASSSLLPGRQSSGPEPSSVSS